MFVNALRCALLFAASALAALGQIDTNSVTVTASRSLTSTPDQALYQVTVQAPLTAGLDDVTAALQGSGLTASNLTGVGLSPALIAVGTGALLPPQPVTPTLSWSFTLTAPLAKLNATMTSLSALQKTVTQKGVGWSLGYSFYGSQTSAAAQPACAAADLMADARARAQKLADAAGLTLGPVSAIAGATDSTCSLTVKFSLLRYQ